MKNKPKQSIANTLVKKGHRVTPQRMMILEAIEASAQHISAEQIHSHVHVRYPYMDISTVYRTLQLLKELELVTEINLGDGRFLYHPAGKSNHHHLRCSKCGKIQDIDEHVVLVLKEELRDHYGFDAELKHLAISGVCKHCRS